MDGSDEAQMQQDILKLQLHAIPLNLNIGQINEVESEDDEFLPENQEDGSYTILDLDKPCTSKSVQHESVNLSTSKNDEEESQDSQDESIVSDDEELIDLSEDLPPTPLNLLKLNLAYQEVIVQEIAKVDNLLKENNYQKTLLAEEQARQAEKESKSPVPKMELGAFNERYFKDYHGNPAGRNYEMERRLTDVGEYFIPNVHPGHRWKKEMDATLREAIKRNAQREATEPLLTKLEYLQDQYKSSGDEKLKQKIDRVREELRDAGPDKVGQLMADRFHAWDWATISNLDMNSEQSAQSCRLRWTNIIHPSVKTGPWTTQEVEQLRGLCHVHADLDWNAISEKMEGRTAMQCCSQYLLKINTDFKRKMWTPEEDEKVMALISKFRVGDCIPYTQVACHMKNRLSSQIVHRWTKTLNPTYKKTRWTPEEDALLLKAVAKYGTKWSQIRDSGLVPGRHDSQLRERYINAYRNVKAGPWSLQEDERLLAVVEKCGPNWSVVAKHMRGRNDSQCLKRYDRVTRMRKKGNVLKYPRKSTVSFYGELQKVRKKLVTSISAELSATKCGTSSTALTEVEAELSRTLAQDSLPSTSQQPSNTEAFPISYRGLKSKLSPEMGSEDVTKVYRELVDVRRKCKNQERTGCFKMTKQERELFLQARELLAECLRPMKCLASEAGNPISDHVTHLRKKSERIGAKAVFVHYVKALNINAEKALESIRRRKLRGKRAPPAPKMSDLIDHETAQANATLVDMKQQMTGKNKPSKSKLATCVPGSKSVVIADDDTLTSNGVDSNRKPQSFIRNLYLPLCAPNYVTARAYRKLLKHREERVTSLKKVLLPSDDDVTENGRFSASAAEMTKNKNALHTGSAVTSASLTPLQPTNAIEGHASITATTSKRDVTSASLNGVATAKSPSEVSPGSNEGKRFSAEQLLSNMRATYKYKVFRSRFNALFTWPTLLSSLVPFTRGKDGVLRPVVPIKRVGGAGEQDGGAPAKKTKLH